jgi:fatty acid amide hydrolase
MRSVATVQTETRPDPATRRTDARRARSEGRLGAAIPGPLLLEAPAADEIAAGVSDGRLDREAVACEHLRRIRLVDPVLNAVAWWIEDPTEGACAEGALAGVPMSIKDQFLVAGTPSTLGLIGRREHRAAADGPLVARLRSAGAVPLVKGNVAQLLAYHESDNPLHGRTLNPWSAERTPGGSSGGDAALVASGAVPLAMTGDLGGSTRVPAHFCGICGFKPTRASLTTADTVDVGLEHVGITPQPGVAARTTGDLVLGWEALSGRPARADIDAVDVAGLRVGWYDDDGWFLPAPAVRRAVARAKDALQGDGVDVVRVAPPNVRRALQLFLGLVARDGSHYLRAAAGEALDPQVSSTLRIGRLPRTARKALAGALTATGQTIMAVAPTALEPLTARRRAQLLDALEDFRAGYRARWRRSGIDALVCPPHALPALRHGQSRLLGPTAAGSYTTLFSVTGHPAGVVPITRVRAGEESDRVVGVQLAARAARACERGSAGLPVGVQVVADHDREAIALAVMRRLERSMRDDREHPSQAERRPA